jgi:hypothetical protein
VIKAVQKCLGLGLVQKGFDMFSEDARTNSTLNPQNLPLEEAWNKSLKLRKLYMQKASQ